MQQFLAQVTYYFIMNFKNLGNVILKKMCKKSIFVKFSSVGCFLKSTRPVNNQLHLNMIQNFTQNHLSSKIHIFAFFTNKKRGMKDTFSERPLLF